MMAKMWSGGSKVMKKMNDPLLLTYSPSEGGGGSGSAGSSRFKNVRGPGGLGYDSMAKYERCRLKMVLIRVEPWLYIVNELILSIDKVLLLLIEMD